MNRRKFLAGAGAVGAGFAIAMRDLEAGPKPGELDQCLKPLASVC